MRAKKGLMKVVEAQRWQFLIDTEKEAGGG
jgi:hypothetical protein